MISRYIKTILFVFTSSMVLNFTYAESLKIGVVNMPRLVEDYSEIKGVQKILQLEFSQKDETLRAISLELKNSQEAIVGSDLTDDSRKEGERKLLNLEREYARLASEFRQDYNLRRNEELHNMHKEITDTILEYAEENGYDLIMESGMIYASEQLQLTDSILNLLKQKLEKQ